MSINIPRGTNRTPSFHSYLLDSEIISQFWEELISYFVWYDTDCIEDEKLMGCTDTQTARWCHKLHKPIKVGWIHKWTDRKQGDFVNFLLLFSKLRKFAKIGAKRRTLSNERERRMRQASPSLQQFLIIPMSKIFTSSLHSSWMWSFSVLRNETAGYTETSEPLYQITHSHARPWEPPANPTKW
jgi:hypothetical protein